MAAFSARMAREGDAPSLACAVANESARAGSLGPLSALPACSGAAATSACKNAAHRAACVSAHAQRASAQCEEPAGADLRAHRSAWRP
jgi:hypothetical protein